MKSCISIFLILLILPVLAACSQDTNGVGELTSELDTSTHILAESSVEQDIGNATENGIDAVTYDYYIMASNPVATTSTPDSSTLLQSIIVTSESQIEVNRTFDNNVSSEGSFYYGKKKYQKSPRTLPLFLSTRLVFRHSMLS